MLRKLLKLLEQIKDHEQYAEKYIQQMITYQIYSPVTVKIMGKKIAESKIDNLDLANTPSEIRNLAVRSSDMQDDFLQKQIDLYWMKKAVFVLDSYQNCPIPLPDNKYQTYQGERTNLLSSKGQKALAYLNDALQSRQLNEKTVKMALKAAHKFYLDGDFYKQWKIDPNSLVLPLGRSSNPKEELDMYPTLQLTKGCLNNCSHCLMRAEPNITHMPYPMFLNLHKQLWKKYKKMPILDGTEIGLNEDVFFGKFFFDSDSLSYHDDIIGVDFGDIALKMYYNKEPTTVMTKGVNTLISKIALKKIINKAPISLSFVDTPLENMVRNKKQLNETLDMFDKYGSKTAVLFHLHLKSGPSIGPEIFRGYPVESVEIYRAGRAKNFPDNELLHLTDETFLPQVVIEPSGDIQIVYFKDKEAVFKKMGSVIKNDFLRHGSFKEWVNLLTRNRGHERG